MDLLAALRGAPRIVLTRREVLDLRLLAEGAYRPVRRFLGRNDLESVLDSMRLAGGEVWPLPILLGLTRREARRVREGAPVVLVSSAGVPLGILEAEEVFALERSEAAGRIFGTRRTSHPGVAAFLRRKGMAVSGPVRALAWRRRPVAGVPARSPAEVRAEIARRGWKTVAGFQTRNPIHRGHEHIHRVVLEWLDGLLIHPLVGPTRRGDLAPAVRIRACRAQVDHYYPADRVLLSLFPAPMWFGGPREALFHALVRRNYGCTHFIVGRDHAGANGFYHPLAAQRIFDGFPFRELGIRPVFFGRSFYCRKCAMTVTERTCPHGEGFRLAPSGTVIRERLVGGRGVAAEVMRPEVRRVLEEPVRRREG